MTHAQCAAHAIDTNSLADTGSTGIDQAFLTGTSGADLFEVNTIAAGGARTVAVNGQKATYTAGLERMTLDGAGNGDTYDVRFSNGPLPGAFKERLVKSIDAIA